MLSRKSSAQRVPEGKPVDTIDTLVGQNSVFKGDLEFTGGLRVDGKIKGNVIATDDSSSTLVLSELGEIEGNVTVPHVIINGTIKGNISSGGRVELQAKAQIIGDVHYRAVEMELGATINGNLVCDPGTKAAHLAAVGEEDRAETEVVSAS
ncbi:MAG: polymer-forming cytoskeletal protein [Gammaproteobacteria bacterium]|nr:polymer-forming cytoskeletal protein [Gammaproteobacteria bacterium]